eukprot:429245-Pelagomonas_calceolata.AAC.2
MEFLFSFPFHALAPYLHNLAMVHKQVCSRPIMLDIKGKDLHAGPKDTPTAKEHVHNPAKICGRMEEVPHLMLAAFANDLGLLLIMEIAPKPQNSSGNAEIKPW